MRVLAVAARRRWPSRPAAWPCTNHWRERLRLDHGLAAVAVADGVAVGLDLLEQARLPRGPRTTALRHANAVQALRSGPASAVIAPVVADDLDARQVVALADLEVVGVVGRGDLQRRRCRSSCPRRRRAMIGISRFRSGRITAVAAQVPVALVLGVHGHGRVAQHGLGPGGGDGDAAGAVREGVADVVEVAVDLLVLDLEVGQRRVAAGAPVDDVVAAVDQPLVVELDEDLAHRAREPLVHGEALALPVAGGAQALELVDDGAAVLLAPLPDLAR